MRRPSNATWISLTLAVFSALLLGTALWPASILSENIPLMDESLGSPQISGRQVSGADFALSLRWPTGLRLGETGMAQLILAPIKGQAPSLTPGFNRMVVAELQADGLVVNPEGEIAEPLSSAGQAIFAWTIQPAYAGTASATMFLRLQLVPQGGGDTRERTVWARPLETRVVAPLGLSQEAELALGVAALIVSAFLMLPRLLGKLGP
jgi:hypothetical protein